MENKVLATVAGEEITEAEFNAFLQNVPREQQAYLSNPAMRSHYLDQHCPASFCKGRSRSEAG